MEKKEFINLTMETLEAIKLYDGDKIFEILSNEIKEANNYYIAASGCICCRCCAPLEYYYLLINKLNLKDNIIEAGLSYEANSERFSINWVEHDLIIAFNKVLKYTEHELRYYTIYNGPIPKDFQLWHVRSFQGYALAVCTKEIINYTINVKRVRAYKLLDNEIDIFNKHFRASSLEELEKHLNSNDLYYREHAKAFKPVLERLFCNETGLEA